LKEGAPTGPTRTGRVFEEKGGGGGNLESLLDRIAESKQQQREKRCGEKGTIRRKKRKGPTRVALGDNTLTQQPKRKNGGVWGQGTKLPSKSLFRKEGAMV